VTERFPAYLAGTLLCIALLVIFHLLFKHAHRTVRYMLGMGAVCSGCTVAGVVLNNPDLAIGPWAIAFWGLIIALWTWVEERNEVGKQSAQKNGEIIGLAQRLIRDVKDDGALDGQSGLDEARRRN
jgi:membrane protein implicated in regulation of membrane protease activity